MVDALHPDREPAIQVVMMPRDTNAAGTIFGGVLMSYLDQAGYIEARRVSHQRYVTVALDAMKFFEPVFVGDLLSFYTRTIRTGRTSIRVCVTVIAERYEDGTRVKVTEAEITYVAIDAQRNPIPVFENMK